MKQQLRMIARSIVVLALLLLPEIVKPCSCLPPSSPQAGLELSDAVFHGTVIAGELFSFTFELSEVWKGPAGQTIEVSTLLPGLCGIPFEIGEDYLVYARRERPPVLLEPASDLWTACYHRTTLFNPDEAVALGEPLWTRDSAIRFIRGDVNGNGSVDVSDAIATLGYLFLGNTNVSCRKSADFDDSGSVELSDAVGVLLHLFIAAPLPPDPFLDCGLDPTADFLTCDFHAACQ
jgi:hypothetical protein